MRIECTEVHISYLDEVLLLSDMAEEKLRDREINSANTLTRAGLVLLCGHFEGFLREMCKEFIQILNDEKVSVDKLPIETLTLHLDDGVNQCKKGDSSVFEKDMDSIKLNTFIPLKESKFSTTDANPTVATIEKLFFYFGIDNVLDKISLSDYDIDDMYVLEKTALNDVRRKISTVINGIVDVDDFFYEIENKWPPKKKRRRVGYLDVIDQLLKKRNIIAHGERLITITPTELKQHCHDIKKLCYSLICELEEKLVDILGE